MKILQAQSGVPITVFDRINGRDELDQTEHKAVPTLPMFKAMLEKQYVLFAYSYSQTYLTATSVSGSFILDSFKSPREGYGLLFSVCPAASASICLRLPRYPSKYI